MLKLMDGFGGDDAIELGVIFLFCFAATDVFAGFAIGSEQQQSFALFIQTANGHGAFGKRVQGAYEFLAGKFADKLAEVAVGFVVDKMAVGSHLMEMEMVVFRMFLVLICRVGGNSFL